MPKPVRDITFGPWTKWTDRGTSRTDTAHGGVYLFAYCPAVRPPAVPTVDQLPQEVVYVGDAKNLNRRPLSGVHHRLQRYEQLFGDPRKTLFVTVAPLYQTTCVEPHVERAFSFYTEAQLVWNYTDRHGHPPAMHYKDKGARPDWVVRAVKRLRQTQADR